jgi:hypothetical protein
LEQPTGLVRALKSTLTIRPSKMAYLIYDTKDEALGRSRQAWEDNLGRKKRPEDVTEYLWGWSEGKDGKCAMIVEEEESKLTTDEQTKLTATLDEANWPKPSLING